MNLATRAMNVDGEDYFVVWDNDVEVSRRWMRGARLNRDGQLIDSVAFNVGPGVAPAPAFNRANLWLVYLHPTISGMTNLLAQPITPQGFLLATPSLLHPPPVPPNLPPTSSHNATSL